MLLNKFPPFDPYDQPIGVNLIDYVPERLWGHDVILSGKPQTHKQKSSLPWMPIIEGATYEVGYVSGSFAVCRSVGEDGNPVGCKDWWIGYGNIKTFNNTQYGSTKYWMIYWDNQNDDRNQIYIKRIS